MTNKYLNNLHQTYPIDCLCAPPYFFVSLMDLRAKHENVDLLDGVRIFSYLKYGFFGNKCHQYIHTIILFALSDYNPQAAVLQPIIINVRVNPNKP